MDTGHSSPVCGFERGRLLIAGLVCVVMPVIPGCGGGSAPPPPQKPDITMQPTDQSVPMGLSATYSVTAEVPGSPSATQVLNYQWLKDGAPIAGATGSSYTTPPTAFTDSGETFTVVVSNASETVTSTPASLTVTARAPDPRDLRFQLVDAPETVNGWGGDGTALGVSNGTAVTGQAFSGTIGTPLEVGVGAWGPGPPYYAWKAPVPGQSGEYYAVNVGYFSDSFSNFPGDLQAGSTAWNINGLNPASGGSVVNSLDLQPTDTESGYPQGTFSASWIEDPQQSGYGLGVGTVDVADLQAAVQQEAADGNVVTAVSGNNGQVTYLAYGWTEDQTTVYEAQVVTSSTADAPAAGADLAQQGYIITASGMSDPQTVVLVGTRVAGDTMPRPFLTSESSQNYQQEGYAIVAVINNSTATTYDVTFLAER